MVCLSHTISTFVDQTHIYCVLNEIADQVTNTSGDSKATASKRPTSALAYVLCSCLLLSSAWKY